MVILAIETAVMSRGSVALLDGKKIFEETYQRQEDYKDQLWPAIDRVLRKAKVSLNEMEGIAVSQGPGSFTGLRVGISVAKTLAIFLRKPLLGISTLEALAQGLDSYFTPLEKTLNSPVPQQTGEIGRRKNNSLTGFKEKVKLLVPILDAKKNLVYAAIFRRKNKADLKVTHRFRRNLWVKRETDDLVLTIEEICGMIKEPAIFLGEGLGIYQKRIEKELGGRAHFASSEFFYPRASTVALLGKEKLRLKKEDNVYALQPIYIREPEISSKK